MAADGGHHRIISQEACADFVGEDSPTVAASGLFLSSRCIQNPEIYFEF
jgi:hypothetical protein